MSGARLPSIKTNVDKEKDGGDFRPKQCLFGVDCAFDLGSRILFFKVVDEVLNLWFDVDVAVGGFSIAAMGFWVVFHSLGPGFAKGITRQPDFQSTHSAISRNSEP
jgi:hypothetical protein